MRNKIRRLEDAGITEDVIVETLQTTHKNVRRKLRDPKELLTPSCRAEMQQFDDYETTDKVIAAQYRTSVTQAHQARYNPLPRTALPTEDQVLMAWHEGHNTVKAIAKHVGSQEKPVRKILEDHGYADPPRKTTVTRGVRPAMLAKIMAGLSYTVIAAEFDCSVSAVSELARANGYGRQVQRKNNMLAWPEILEYAAEHTVTEAAQKYNVERSNIYYHRSKDDDKAPNARRGL